MRGEAGLFPRMAPVDAPAETVFRIAHRRLRPFEPPPWEFARPDGTFGHRFDDPSKSDGRPESERFRVVYGATRRAAAFAETLANFRPQLRVIAGYEAVEESSSAAVLHTDPEDSRRGIVPRTWRADRHLCTTTLDPSLRFVDIMAGESIHHLRLALAPIGAKLGLSDLDVNMVLGPYRRLTQARARYIYDLTDLHGRPSYAGIRYVSRLNPSWECWALFSDRLRHTLGLPETIFPDDPGLTEAAALLGLTIEGFEGQYLRPWRR